MKLNDTQKRVLAAVFGKADPEVTVACPPSKMGFFVNPGSKEWTFACHLHELGVARIVRRQDDLCYVRRACDENGPIGQSWGEKEILHHPARFIRQKHINNPKA